MKSTEFYCLVLMTKYIYTKQLTNSWLPELIIKNNYLNNYLEKLFCQAY